MKAVVTQGHGSPEVLIFRDIEAPPAPKARQVLVRVRACGVCRRDILVRQGPHRRGLADPLVLGHEISGEVMALGPDARGLTVGERVCSTQREYVCGCCSMCRTDRETLCPDLRFLGQEASGGYAEYVRVLPFVFPGIVRIPARNTFLEGAMLEPVNTVLKAVERLSLLPADTVLVAGQGPIGLMFTRILALRGINVIATDLLRPRLAIAQEFGAKWVWVSRPSAPPGRRVKKVTKPDSRNSNIDSLARLVERLTQGQGLDAAVIAVPLDSVVQEAQKLLRGGGQLLLFSHTRRGEKSPIDLATVCVDEKDLLGSYSADVTLQRESARLVFSRKLDVRRLITHQFPLEQTSDAIQLAAHPTNDSLKIVVSQMGKEPAHGTQVES